MRGVTLRPVFETSAASDRMAAITNRQHPIEAGSPGELPNAPDPRQSESIQAAFQASRSPEANFFPVSS
jgi:hypothetical protein